MAAGSIVVDLLMKTGSFETDTNRATKNAEKRLKEMERTAKQVGAAMGATFAAAGAASLYMSKQLIDGIDALNDVADATGSTVEKISALEDTALRTGTSMDTVTGALVKFNQQLGQADGKDDFSAAMKKIGLEVDALKKMDPADALLETAKALSQWADDGDKARLVQVAFGKSVAEVAPLLKDLAEKGQLVATVTTEQAKQAEDFNKQLSAMEKNATDAGRAIVGSFLPALNAIAEKGRDQGLMALLGFDKDFFDKKAVAGLVGDMKAAQAELNRMKAGVLRGTATQADVTRAEAAFEEAKQRFRAEDRLRLGAMPSVDVSAFGAMNDSEAARLAGRTARPSVGPLPAKAGPKGKDPDADFKAYLNNLQQQIQKTNDLSVSEKLLDDIRRGSLTVSPEQQKQLAALAQIVDKEKELTEQLKLRREASIAPGLVKQKEDEGYQAWLQTMKDSGPAAQLEKQRTEMLKLTEALQAGHLTEAEYLDTVTGRLGLVGSKLTETTDMAGEFSRIFGSGLQDLASGGARASDVFENMGRSIANLILKVGVLEPMAKRLKDAFQGVGGDSGGGFNWGKLISGAIGGAFGGAGQAAFSGTSIGASGFGTGLAYGNMDIGGFLANGGPANASVPYIVGERGPELFIPRTSGSVVPNHALGGAQKDNITIINQTTGRIDKVVEQRISRGERALIIQEAEERVAMALSNPNSRVSRSMNRNYPVQRSR